MNVARLVYEAASEVAVDALVLPAELLRIAAGRSTRRFLAERLGASVAPAAAAPRLLVHAVSVGEMAAAGALLDALGGGFSFVLTTGNTDGRAAAERIASRVPGVDSVSFLPWDRPRTIERWLAGLDVRGVVVVETEIWPGLFLACERLGIPLLLANARLYPRDVPRYRRLRPFFRKVLDATVWIGAQSSEDAEAFVSIGAPRERVEVTGNLKLDVRIPEPLPEAWKRSLSLAHPLVVAGSTHPPEEELILSVIDGLGERAERPRLVVAPRHPRRAAEIVALARRRGVDADLFSAGPPPQGWAVLVVDTMGSLAALYAHADVAIVGGSFVPCGGQNPLEPAAYGRPIVAGPDMSNFADIATGLGDAIVRVTSSELDPALRRLLASPALRADLGARARAYIERNQGAAGRTAVRVRDQLALGLRAL